MSGSALCADGLVAFVERTGSVCTLIEAQIEKAASAVPDFCVVSQVLQS